MEYILDRDQLEFLKQQPVIFNEHYQINQEHANILLEKFELDFAFANIEKIKDARQKLVRSILRYDEGRDILKRLILMQNQLQIGIVYKFQVLDELINDLYEIQSALFSGAISRLEEMISERLTNVFKSILGNMYINLVRRRKEFQAEKIDKEIYLPLLTKLEDQYFVVQSKNFCLSQSTYYQEHEAIFQDQIFDQRPILKAFIINDFNKENYQSSLQQGKILELFKVLNIYQQQLLITRLKQITQEETSFRYAKQYKFILQLDTEDKLNIDLGFFAKNWVELNPWKPAILYNLWIQMHPKVLELLMVSSIAWNHYDNADIIVTILIERRQYLLAHSYVKELQKEAVFRFFLNLMLANNESLKHLKMLTLDSSEIQILYEVVMQHELPKLYIYLAHYLLEKRQFRLAMRLANQHQQHIEITIIEMIKALTSKAEFQNLMEQNDVVEEEFNESIQNFSNDGFNAEASEVFQFKEVLFKQEQIEQLGFYRKRLF